jgi:protein TonB
MNDPVSEELARRAHLDLPWRWAILGAFGLHIAVAATLFLAPSHRQRALSLPTVQVRLAAAPAAPAGPKRAAAARTSPPVPEPAPKAPAKKAIEPAPRHPLPAKTAVRQAPPETGLPSAGPAGPALAGQAASSPAGIALGVGTGGGDESFPFTYYLNRVLALIESNWFRPPAPPDTRCRVRCVIDRAGRLLEAGLEQESASAAFDRAALRAVYAAAPLPPLPQGFGGATLTLHLEFGP